MTIETLERPAVLELQRTSGVQSMAPPIAPSERLHTMPLQPTFVFMYGLAGVGKDTVAAYLREKHDFVTLALADAVKDEYERWYGDCDYRQHRDRLIAIGEGYKRIYGQDVWCDEAVLGVRALVESGYTRLAITDGRYEHEYDYFVTQRLWTPVQITTKTATRLSRLTQRDGTAQAHTLNFEVDNFITSPPAHAVSNDGTLADLYASLDALVECL